MFHLSGTRLQCTLKHGTAPGFSVLLIKKVEENHPVFSIHVWTSYLPQGHTWSKCT